MKELWELFLTFFRIGLFTFGGGYAMISLIEDCCVEKKQWITHDELMNITVLAESTPGPVAVNCATFVGCRRKGVPGAIAATLGVILPSFLIIYGISRFLDRFLEIRWVASAFRGIRLAVGLLIVDVAIKMIRRMNRDWLSRTILCCAAAAMLAISVFSLRFSSVALMLLGGAVSLAVFAIRGRGKGGGAK